MNNKIQAVNQIRQLVVNVRNEVEHRFYPKERLIEYNYQIGTLSDCQGLVEFITPLLQKPETHLTLRVLNAKIEKYEKEIVNRENELKETIIRLNEMKALKHSIGNF